MIQGLPECAAVGRDGQDGGTAPGGGPAAPYQGGSKPRRTGWSSSSASAAARRDPAAPTTEPHGPRGEPRARAGWRYAAHCICPIFSAHRHLLDNSNGSLAVNRVKLARPLDRATTIYTRSIHSHTISMAAEVLQRSVLFIRFTINFD